MVKVLVVEDEASIREMIALNLRRAGMEAVEADSAEAALPLLEQRPGCDAAILDVMLPGMNGFSLCETIRRTDQKIGIIILSAKGQEQDKIRGLSIGADDYMTKPFSPSELVARVKAHMARYERLVSTNMPKNDIVEIRGIKIDKTARRVWVNGEEKAFTTKEFDLLTFLAEHPNHVFTKEELFSEIWDMESIGDIATVTVHIKKIREKIEFNTAKPQYIETIWGVGYRFKI